MRYAVIADIHANATALKTVLADAGKCGVERIVCLGDIVGYGPQPEEAVTLVRQCAGAVVAGNHDDAVCGRIDAADFIELAADAVARHREALSEESLAWLGTLGYTCKFEGAVAAHGDFIDPCRFRYVSDEKDARGNFEATTAQLMFVGHTHEPGVFLSGQSGKIYRLEPQDFSIEEGKRYIINPGSVGYPREANGECRSTYVIYDSDKREVFFRALPFAVSGMIQRGDGKVRKPGRTAVVALSVGLVALLTAVSLFLLIPRQSGRTAGSAQRTEGEPVAAAVPAAKSLDFEKRSLTLPMSAAKVSPMLVLKRHSCPVELRMIFKSDSGKELGTQVITVKQTNKRWYSIPTGAISAHFTISRQTPADSPAIDTFAPAFK